MSATSLWLRLGVSWSAAVALLVAAAPAPPGQTWRPAAAVAPCALCGVLLFLAVGGRRRPALVRPRAATVAVLIVSAGAEEVVWRWFALGELALHVGAAPALGATGVAFALAHRESAAQHLVTGAAFGGLYLATGSLAGVWCAHAAYNLCIAADRSGAAA